MVSHAGEAFALGAAVCWAIGPLIAYHGVAALGTFRFAQYRYALSTLMLGGIVLVAGYFSLPATSALLLLVLSGALGVAAGEASLFRAVYLLGPRRASMAFSVHAPVTAFMAVVVFHETFSVPALAGVILAAFGVWLALACRPDTERSRGVWHIEDGLRPGLACVGAAVVFQVLGALLAKPAMEVVDPVLASTIRTASAMVVFLPFYLLYGERTGRVQSAGMGWVALSAGISTVAGMTLLLAAFARTELYRAVILSSLAPALQVLLLRVFRGERFPVGAWAGTVIAIAGAILAALST